jgi:hypothetical protein
MKDDPRDKTAVILSIEEFQELMEDIEDLAAVAGRREEPTISHEQLLAELKEDGLLSYKGNIGCRGSSYRASKRCL